jgi:hypothetical protein
MLKITFSNKCQLACRSCISAESSTFAQVTNTSHQVEFLEVDITDEHFEYLTGFIVQLFEKYKRVNLHINGGESLIQNGAHKILNWAIENNYNSRMGIVITTALSVALNDTWKNYTDLFDGVTINCSIDSVGENYQYVRWPVKFDKLERNLLDLTLVKLSTVLITPVFTLNNIFYLKDYLDYWLEFFQTKTPLWYNWVMDPISAVNRTRHLDVDALAPQYRCQLNSLIDSALEHEFLKKYPVQTQGLKDWLEVTKIQPPVPDQSALWEKYLTQTAFFDIKTNTNFAQHNKKFFDRLTSEDQQKFIKIRTSTDSTVVVEFNRYS